MSPLEPKSSRVSTICYNARCVMTMYGVRAANVAVRRIISPELLPLQAVVGPFSGATAAVATGQQPLTSQGAANVRGDESSAHNVCRARRGAWLAVPIFTFKGPENEHGEAQVPAECPSQASIACAQNQSFTVDERAYGPFSMFLPSLSAGYAF